MLKNACSKMHAQKYMLKCCSNVAQMLHAQMLLKNTCSNVACSKIHAQMLHETYCKMSCVGKWKMHGTNTITQNMIP